MDLNKQVIFFIVIIGIITAGVVGASVLNNGTMKQADFDGIKISVPSDSEFINTGNGFVDSKYGISIHTFKDNGSIVNYLNGINGASVISLDNQPPQSVAFTQGDDTNVLLTNGAEGISIGAKDQDLVSKMSNSVVFSNHQKSTKPSAPLPGIAPPHLSMDNDFNLIIPIINQTNNVDINMAVYEAEMNVYVEDINSEIDNGQDPYADSNDQLGDVFNQGSNEAGNQESSSLMDNSQVSNLVENIGGDDSSQPAAAGGDSASVADSSSSGGSSAAPASGGNSPADDNQQDKLSQLEIKDLLSSTGYVVKDIKDKGSYYLVTVEDSSSDGVEDIKIDAYTGNLID